MNLKSNVGLKLSINVKEWKCKAAENKNKYKHLPIYT